MGSETLSTYLSEELENKIEESYLLKLNDILLKNNTIDKWRVAGEIISNYSPKIIRLFIDNNTSKGVWTNSEKIRDKYSDELIELLSVNNAPWSAWSCAEKVRNNFSNEQIRVLAEHNAPNNAWVHAAEAKKYSLDQLKSFAVNDALWSAWENAEEIIMSYNNELIELFTVNKVANSAWENAWRIAGIIRGCSDELIESLAVNKAPGVFWEHADVFIKFPNLIKKLAKEKDFSEWYRIRNGILNLSSPLGEFYSNLIEKHVNSIRNALKLHANLDISKKEQSELLLNKYMQKLNNLETLEDYLQRNEMGLNNEIFVLEEKSSIKSLKRLTNLKKYKNNMKKTNKYWKKEYKKNFKNKLNSAEFETLKNLTGRLDAGFDEDYKFAELLGKNVTRNEKELSDLLSYRNKFVNSFNFIGDELQRNVEEASYEYLKDYVWDLKENKAFRNNINSANWNVFKDGYIEKFKTKTTSNYAENLESKIKHHENEIVRLSKGINDVLNNEFTLEKLAKNKSKLMNEHPEIEDKIRDFMVQYNALKSLKGENIAVNGKKHDIEISLETNPLKVLQMGELVNGSCLSIGGGNSWSAVTNALDVNKSVVWVKDKRSNVIGRVLIGVTDDGNLTRFRTYTSRNDIEIEPYIDEYLVKLAEKSGLGLGKGELKLLNGQDWYNDGQVNIET